jgi:hypothetical protein
MRILKDIGSTIATICQVANEAVKSLLPYVQAIQKTGAYIESEVDSMVSESKQEQEKLNENRA